MARRKKEQPENNEEEILYPPTTVDRSYEDMDRDELIRTIHERDMLIRHLTAEIGYFKRDGLPGSLYALNYQLNKINEQILSANVTLSGNDKQFERFWKIMTEIQEVHVSINNLKNMLFPKSADEVKEEDVSHNFMDNMAFKEK